MRYGAFALLIVGIVAGTFVACLDVDDVHWRLFVPAIVVAALGVQQVRRDRRARAGTAARLHAQRDDLETSLQRLVDNLGELRSLSDSLSPFDVRHEIDRRLRDDLALFAAARATIAQLYGLQAYADIVSEFAAGERCLNRVWSASADGWPEEVQTGLELAQVRFQHARRRLQAVQAH